MVNHKRECAFVSLWCVGDRPRRIPQKQTSFLGRHLVEDMRAMDRRGEMLIVVPAESVKHLGICRSN